MYFVKQVYLCGERYYSNRRTRGETAHKSGVKDAKPNWESKAESEGLQTFYFWKEKINYTSPTLTSPGNTNTFRNSGLLSVLFPLSHHAVAGFSSDTYYVTKVYMQEVNKLSLLITFFPIQERSIPVKLHQVYFLKLSLEIPDHRCIYHVYMQQKF